MFNKVIVLGAAAAAALAFVGPALATPAVTSVAPAVNVNIHVLPTVSMWANNLSVDLNLDGTGQENRAVVASSLSVINNVDANVSASVAGTLPADIGGENAVNFFIFNDVTPANATSAIIANSNTPSGALVWTNDNLGTSQQLIASTGVNQNIANFPITYAADAPNALPAVADWGLTVTYTITSN